MQIRTIPFSDAKEALEKRLNRRVRHLTKKNYQIIVEDAKKAFKKAKEGEDPQRCYSNTKKTTLYIKDGGAYCELLSILWEYEGEKCPNLDSKS